MSATIKWESANSRTTGISSANLSAGANLLGSEIDNSSNKDRFAAIEVGFECSSAPTANRVIEVYLVYAVNGTDYEDGNASTDPTITPIGFAAARAVTAAQKVTIKNVLLVPFKFKILLKSELDQNATGVTVLCYTHNEEIS